MSVSLRNQVLRVKSTQGYMKMDVHKLNVFTRMVIIQIGYLFYKYIPEEELWNAGIQICFYSCEDNLIPLYSVYI